MPELEFTIDTATGEFTTHIGGIAGPACDDLAKLVKELAGEPRREQRTSDYTLRPRIHSQSKTRIRTRRG